MARKKFTIDFYPHYVNGSATKHALERRYGNDGYAFWFKLLEVLCSTGTMYLDMNELSKREWLMDITHTPETKTYEMVEYLASLGAIDKDLWETQKIIWCDNLITNLEEVFKRRAERPQKPLPLNNPPLKTRVD